MCVSRGNEPRLILLSLLAFFAALAGCGKSGLERVYVSGKVSYNAKPVEIGQIRFIPVDATQGPITIEQIHDGTFATNTSGGVPLGNHRIELRMYDAEEYRSAPRVAGSPAVKQLLPNKYNRDSKLTIQIDSGSRSIEHDFVLDK